MVVNRVLRITDRKGGEFQMLHARQDWSDSSESADVIAFPAKLGTKGDFGCRPLRERFSLVVDLHSEEVGPRWFRGVATLAALCGAAFFLAPGFEPFIASRVAATPTAPIRNAQLSDLARTGNGQARRKEHSEAGRSPRMASAMESAASAATSRAVSTGRCAVQARARRSPPNI